MTGASLAGRCLRALLLASALALACAPQSHALDSGAAAPAFSLPGKSGNIALEALRGQWVYVDFWASWCGPCKQSFPWMNEMHDKYGARGLRIIAINVDARQADAERFLQANPARFAVAFDARGETPKRYEVKAMPSSFLIDPQGRIQLVHAGFRDSDRAALDARFAAALKQGSAP